MRDNSLLSFFTNFRSRLAQRANRRPQLAADIIRTVYDLWKVDPDRAQWVGNLSGRSDVVQGWYAADRELVRGEGCARKAGSWFRTGVWLLPSKLCL